jgi:hypothetical protein
MLRSGKIRNYSGAGAESNDGAVRGVSVARVRRAVRNQAMGLGEFAGMWPR